MPINKEELELLRLAYEIKLLGLEEERFLQLVAKLRNAAAGEQLVNTPIHRAPTLDDIQQAAKEQIQKVFHQRSMHEQHGAAMSALSAYTPQ